jgi:phage gp36-like protein
MATPNVYATIADLEALGIAADALRDIDPDIKNRVLAAMSRRIDQALTAQCVLPLRMKVGDTDWGQDLIDMCVNLSAYRLLASRGFNPEGIDQNIRLMYEDAQELLKRWARNDGEFPDVVDSSSAPREQVPTAGPSISSAPSRGWSPDGADIDRADARIPFSGGRW